ncbi:hypothetical protein BD626DRAFT_505869 [Schizophyllum amplum]|uniref:Conidiation protein 6-domain-containing protein n=1 Tax=Schizophyllum amplum TaxID=97359 RepID=A0A550C5Z9_9AGAR|nr:hypothetical protein BD626DRAFT_505869 [Auriculariopsis ampla]
MSQNNSHKNPERVAAGYKGTLNNPTAGKEAKEMASERLNDMGDSHERSASAKSGSRELVDGFESDDEYVPGRDDERTGLGDYLGGSDSGIANEHSGKNKNNVIGGYKATINNPKVGDEAKQRAREFLDEHDVEHD